MSETSESEFAVEKQKEKALLNCERLREAAKKRKRKERITCSSKTCKEKAWGGCGLKRAAFLPSLTTRLVTASEDARSSFGRFGRE
ncbi:unnamed protein product [Sphagnum jensenii]|jgi:hypothetical protein|uniref:Uncharacterized protein n=1 Tax=Sphagnum jensenii TaxID=128206 RepID=A0ABP0VW15_9BRYO